MRLKDVAILNPVYEGEDFGEDAVSFSPMECLRYDSLLPTTAPFSSVKGKYTYFADNDVLFAKVTPCFENMNTAVASNLVNGIGFGSSEINVLRLLPGYFPRFFFYLACSKPFIDRGCASMCGVGGLKRVKPLAINTFEFNFPDYDTQKSLADYLDRECERIGREIELLERKAEAYRRLRRSIINRAVTRGLDPNVPLKDSGNSWIGQIPEHWSIARNKDLFFERDEFSETGDEELLSVSEYYGVAKRADKVDGENISRAESLVGYKKCFVGDIVTNIMLAWKGSLGRTDFDGIVSPAYGVYAPLQHFNSRYFHFLFRTEQYKSIFKAFSKGIIESRLRLYSYIFFGLFTHFPPIEEQNEIVKYIDDKCSKIEAVETKIGDKIEKLKELKRSLINEVITGQRAIL